MTHVKGRNIEKIFGSGYKQLKEVYVKTKSDVQQDSHMLKTFARKSEGLSLILMTHVL